jgi:hypothetical protein
MATHPDDGKYVVVKDGQRVSGQLHEKQADAQAEAEQIQKKQPVVEGQGGTPKPAPPPEVKQNLYG